MTFDDWWATAPCNTNGASRKVCARLAWRASRRAASTYHRFTIFATDPIDTFDMTGATIYATSHHEAALAVAGCSSRAMRLTIRGEGGNGQGERVYNWDPDDASLTMEEATEGVW